MEEWRPVFGWEGYYEVSDAGHVRSVKRGEIIEGSLSKGYWAVTLSRPGMRRQARVPIAHLVAWAFLGPIPLGHIVHHEDRNRQNNAASNLKIVYDHAAEHPDAAPRGEAHYKAKLTEEKVLKIRTRYAAGERQQDLALEYGVSTQHIGKIVKQQTWQEVGGPMRQGPHLRRTKAEMVAWRARMSAKQP